MVVSISMVMSLSHEEVIVAVWSMPENQIREPRQGVDFHKEFQALRSYC